MTLRGNLTAVRRVFHGKETSRGHNVDNFFPVGVGVAEGICRSH